MAFGGSTAAVMTLYSGHKAKVIKLGNPKQASARLQELRHDLSATLAHGRMVGLEMGATTTDRPRFRVSATTTRTRLWPSMRTRTA